MRNTLPLIHVDLGLGPLTGGSHAQGEGPGAVISFLPVAYSPVRQSRGRGGKRPRGRPAPAIPGPAEGTGGTAGLRRTRSEER